MTQFLCDVASGLVPGRTNTTIFGYVAGVTALSLPVNIWDGNTLRNISFVGESLQIRSDNAADTAAGTGARTILIVGLDASYNEIIEVVTLNGTTPVALIQSFMRRNVVVVLSAGSGRSNVGNIIIETPAAALRDKITAGKSIQRSAHYTVPVGKILWLQNFVFTMAKSGGAEATAHISPIIVQSSGVDLTALEATYLRANNTFIIPSGFALQEKSMVHYRVDAVSQDGFDIGFGATGILTDLNAPGTKSVSRLYT
jgi:hypothetical protein